MPITVNEIERNEATCTFEVGGQEGTVTYTPWSMTPQIEDDVKKLEKSHGNQTVLARMLSEVIVSWDVSWNEGDDPIPVNFESLKGVPTVILAAAMGAIMAHMQPGADEKKASGGGSLNRQTTTARRSGTGNSKPRNT